MPVRIFEFDDVGFLDPGRGEATEYLQGRGERFSFAAAATEYLQGRLERLCFLVLLILGNASTYREEEKAFLSISICLAARAGV